jgi:hypothetical protein
VEDYSDTHTGSNYIRMPFIGVRVGRMF